MDKTDNTNLSFRQKLDNFMYHYKWHTIAVCFIIFVVIWAGASLISNGGGEDMYIGYIGEYAYSNEEIGEIQDKMSKKLSFDINGDQKTSIGLMSFHYYTAEQIENKAQEAKDKGEDWGFYPELNAKNYEHFVTELDNGSTSVWLVSKEVYEGMDKSALVPIESILGYTPERGAVDEYAIDCSTLPFCNETTREISFNTYLVLRVRKNHSFIMGEGKAQEELENAKKLFCAIVEYKK